MRESYARRQREKPKKPFTKKPWLTKTKPPKPRAPIKKQSRGRRREMGLYYQERAEYLQRPENSACRICPCIDQYPAPATEVHHRRGRSRALLRDQRFWTPSCRSCRDVPHARPNWAREVGLLSSAAEWGISPEKMP